MTLADPLRVVLVGAGLMGRAWRDTIEAAPGVELAGIADIDPATAEATAAALGRPVPTDPGLPAVAGHRQGGAERPPGRAADRLPDRHPQRRPARRRHPLAGGRASAAALGCAGRA